MTFLSSLKFMMIVPKDFLACNPSVSVFFSNSIPLIPDHRIVFRTVWFSDQGPRLFWIKEPREVFPCIHLAPRDEFIFIQGTRSNPHSYREAKPYDNILPYLFSIIQFIKQNQDLHIIQIYTLPSFHSFLGRENCWRYHFSTHVGNMYVQKVNGTN